MKIDTSNFCNKMGKMIHSMVVHLDAVTSLAVYPKRVYLNLDST